MPGISPVGSLGLFSLLSGLHVGSLSLSFREILIGASAALYFFVVLNILRVSFPSLLALLPALGIYPLLQSAATWFFTKARKPLFDLHEAWCKEARRKACEKQSQGVKPARSKV